MTSALGGGVLGGKGGELGRDEMDGEGEEGGGEVDGGRGVMWGVMVFVWLLHCFG